MRTLRALLLPCLLLTVAAMSLSGYTFDYTKSPVIADSTRWQTNTASGGSVSFISTGVAFSGNGGSLISIPSISGTNSNDYEISTTLAIKSGGGTYIQFFRAGSLDVHAGTGNYVSVELVPPVGFTSPGAATLNINQSTGGAITQLGSTTITASDGMVLESVIWGGNLYIFVNNVCITWVAVPTITGNPGIGGYGMNADGSGFTSVSLGPHSTITPPAIVTSTIASSVFPTTASLRWQPVSEGTSGVPVFEYEVYRDGSLVGYVVEPEFVDTTLTASTSHTYQILAGDMHGNWSASATNFTVSTPPAWAIDPRRVGVFTTGSYWGGGGEQLDTLSGNLNFTLPLLKAQGRNGWTVPVNLSYNSQNWRQEGMAPNQVNWQLGDDVGYGFGWKAQIGSITPYYAYWWAGVDHYVFEDGTGAQYRLDQNNGGVWSSSQGIYVWFDANANVLHFKDGTFWNMGCTSGGTEADAGTLYPTIIEDVNGNQVLVTYQAGAGLPLGNTNTSARFSSLEDVRGKGSSTYTFIWDSSGPIPHLTGIRNYIATGESFNLHYTYNVTLAPPFGTSTDPNWTGQTTTQLDWLAPVSSLEGVTSSQALVTPYAFTYDTAGASELQQVTFPYGGYLKWTYGNDAYVSNRELRAVTGRLLKTDLDAKTAAWSYGISRDDASAQTIHGSMTLTDASGNGTKTWNFTRPTDPTLAWQVGLVSSFVQSGSSVLQSDSYAWSQTPPEATGMIGRPYIATKTTVMDGTTSAKSTQTLDRYGNTTAAVTYPYNSPTTPLRTYASTYLNSSAYTSNYIFDRLVTTTMYMGTDTIHTKTLVTNTYDAYPAYTPYGYTPPTLEMDASPSIPFSHRGLLTSSVTPAKSSSMNYYSYGGLATGAGSDGTSVTASADSSTNYAAPQSIATQSYSETVAYNLWLGITQTTGANGEQLSMVYDPYTGRPTSGTSPYGAVTGYSYSGSGALPATQTQTGPTGTTTTTLDGVGHTISVVTNGAKVDTVYAPCACSPLGKVQKVSAPYAVGGSPAGWTIYSYDGLGRTLSVQQPDGASTTTTSYSGNQTTVTDPAGNWKTFMSDVEGNLVTVVEPDPSNQPGGTLTTNYSYDWMNHLAGVSMPRGGTTQTRTFVYDDAGRLTSAANPENGTVTYYYNADNTLNYKHDAKGQDTVYSYDPQKRVITVQRYPTGKTNAEDLCQHVSYAYDTNPYDSSGKFVYTLGRLAAARYPVCAIPAAGQTPSVTEMYSYTPAGLVTIKRLQIYQPYYDSGGTSRDAWDNVDADYTYTNWGAESSVTLPTQSTAACGNCAATIVPVTYSYGFDSGGRPNSLVDNNPNSTNGMSTTWVQNVQYDYAGRLSSWQRYAGTFIAAPGYGVTPYPVDTGRIETLGYNVSGQLTSMNWSVNTPLAPGTWSTAGGIQYAYSPTQNNGQITTSTDTVSQETITYQYDALKRVISAAAAPNSGGTSPAWTQTFGYDGYGNLTSKTLNGTTTAIPVKTVLDPPTGNQITTNQLLNAGYDANGNMTSGSGVTVTYDEANRVASATPTSGGTEYYNYAPGGKRVVRVPAGGSAPEWTFWGAHGERLGTFNVTQIVGNGQAYLSVLNPVVMFAGKKVWEGGHVMVQDRLGTVAGSGLLPYGELQTGTSGTSGAAFATYWRDGFTGLDYADQRYYASGYGRFNSPDPYKRSAKLNDSGSWNRYAYTRGDPINRFDRRGLDDCDPDEGCDGDDCDPNEDGRCACDPDAGCGDGGGGGEPTQPPAPPGGPTAPPKCTPDQLVQQVILADASKLGLAALAGGQSTVQLAGAPCSPPDSPGCGSNGLFTQTEVNFSGLNGVALQSQLAADGFDCYPGQLVGAPHKNPGDPLPGGGYGRFGGNCRQDVGTNSLQVNFNVSSGTAQVDIDPYNPAYGLLFLGLHGFLQVLGNKISGGDTSYATVQSALKLPINCTP